MQQYWDIKNQHLDKILLFRMGDFYELFHDDAVKAAPILNISLTSRSKAQGVDIPMCGVPHHSIGPHINKLLARGLKVAICDQIENPATMEGKIVKRAVTRVVTPGLVYDPDQLDAKTSHYVMSLLSKKKGLYDLAAVDASSGEMKAARNISASQVILWTQKLKPREFLLPENFFLFFDPQTLVTSRTWSPGQSAEEFLTSYVQETQGSEILQTLGVSSLLENSGLKVSETCLKHLEVFKTYENQESGSLFEAIDLTGTPMGARLLKSRLTAPFSDLEVITREQDLVEKLFKVERRDEIKSRLAQVGDLDRKIVKLSNSLCNSRDLFALAKSLVLSLEIYQEFKEQVPDFFENKSLLFITAGDLCRKILTTLQDELPPTTRDGGIIRAGYNPTLDEFVDLSTHAQAKLSELENKERKNSGINNLKIKYNNVFGYSFEITNSNLDKTPAHFVRRQTLAGAERFVTGELSELEQKILSAQKKRCELEFSIYNDLRKKTLEKALDLLSISRTLAHLDLALAFARLSYERDYVRPRFVTSGVGGIKIKNSRHPVLELRSLEPFIPNDIELPKENCLLLTGPNMAGKSTLMRQVALTVLLAQIGCFVPATSAELPLIDQIFTRIGASDNLSRGLSTFMVEMTETAQIIREATSNSLIILDEIGRGTSTYDGLSLAQAVLEHFVTAIKGYVFFATHYHELTDLALDYTNIVNAHMSIEEHKEGLVFLRKLTKGPANRSYGIEVAKLAGLPPAVVAKAAKILRQLTLRADKIHQRNGSASGENRHQLDLIDQFLIPSLEGLAAPDIKAETEAIARLARMKSKIRQIDVNQITPLNALQILAELQTDAEHS